MFDPVRQDADDSRAVFAHRPRGSSAGLGGATTDRLGWAELRQTGWAGWSYDRQAGLEWLMWERGGGPWAGERRGDPPTLGW